MIKNHVLNEIIKEVDNALRTILPPVKRVSSRLSPAAGIEEACLTAPEKKHIAGLMRINHSGEVCAQALYQGQALTAQLTHIKAQMQQAAEEEVDHLAWCEERLSELKSNPSLLNPFWYLGSFVLGAIAGLAGDKVSLGFVAETEHQVSRHLQEHLNSIPAQDQKTRIVLKKMQEDEDHHAQMAVDAGAIVFPYPVKMMMRMMSKVMTKSTYHL